MRKIYVVMLLLGLTGCGDWAEDNRTPAQRQADWQQMDRASQARTQQFQTESNARRQNEKRKQDWLRTH